MDTFEPMGATTPESGAPVRSLCFNPPGDALLTATAEAVRTWVWEDYEVVATHPGNVISPGSGASGGGGVGAGARGHQVERRSNTGNPS